MTDQEPLIELKGISKAFGNKVILNNFNLKIYRGDALVVIGPSGTGKSTVLRIIAGLLEADEGEIYINGQLRKGLIEDRQDPIGIGMVFQQAALFDSMTMDTKLVRDARAGQYNVPPRIYSAYNVLNIPSPEIRKLIR